MGQWDWGGGRREGGHILYNLFENVCQSSEYVHGTWGEKRPKMTV